MGSQFNSLKSSILKILLLFVFVVLLEYICVVICFNKNNYLIGFNTNITLDYNVRNIVSHKFVTNTSSKYSKFRCTGDENNINAWQNRLCIFNNICYNVKKDQFEYYRRLRKSQSPLFYDSKLGMLQDFGNKFLSLTLRGGQPWSPVVVNQSCPQTNITWLSNLHTLWRPYFGGDNFGHTVWEDFGSIHYSLQRMNEFDDQLMIMHTNKVPRDSNFVKYLDTVLITLTSKPLLEYKSYLATFNTNYVCFQKFMAGSNLVFFIPEGVREHDGREALLDKWRSKIIAHHRFDPKYIPTEHRIVITNKSASIWAKGSSGLHCSIANLHEVVKFVRETYPRIPVDVIEWHKIPFIKQIELLLKTTILITPCGGVSMIAPFLPHGSHAIIMDYYVSVDGFGFEKGSSASMEGMLLNHFPHFKKDYYQIYDSTDYVFDIPGTQDTRNDASILIKLDRLRLLIETALDDMNLYY